MDMDRCRREIAAIEAELLAGNPDVEGLCLALSDWSVELRILLETRWVKALAERSLSESHGPIASTPEEA
jgi:hypothetical protein